jgi:putative spermidine/putrescine transport system ATP-binding protein
MSDRIVVMNEGRIEQIGTPFEIYNYPRTRFVASFVGTLEHPAPQVLDAAAGPAWPSTARRCGARGERGCIAGGRAIRSRSGRSRIVRGRGGRNQTLGTIEEVSFLGSVVRIRVRFGDSAVSLDTFNNPNAPPPERGQAVTVNFAREDLLVLEGAEPV